MPRKSVVAVCATAALAGAFVIIAPIGQRAAQQAALVRGNAPLEWRYWGADAWSTRYSAADQIDASNFDSLQVQWRWEGGKYYGESRHKLIPSRYDLAFFEYMGALSERAVLTCKNCGFYKVAHEPAGPYRADGKLKTKGICDSFEAHGAFEFDTYYCGCWGWD